MGESNAENKFEQFLDSIIEGIPSIDSNKDYWLVRANSGEFYRDFQLNDYIGIGWNEISLNDIENAGGNPQIMKRTLKDKLNVKKDISENQFGIWSGQLLRFYNNIKIDDFVVVPSTNSSHFIVGKVIGPSFELSQEELEAIEPSRSYKSSDFMKRFPVEWIGDFSRSEADSALYKLIYSQQTLTKINEYKPFINRALFKCYIDDGKLHLTYKVRNPNDVSSRDLGRFIYLYGDLNYLLDSDNEVDVKVNVQSPGDVELIAPVVQYAIAAFILSAGGIFALHGGRLKILGNEFDFPGLLHSIDKRKKAKVELEKDKVDLDKGKLERIKMANDISKEIGVSMENLDIKLPEELLSSIKEAQDKYTVVENKKEKSDD